MAGFARKTKTSPLITLITLIYTDQKSSIFKIRIIRGEIAFWVKQKALNDSQNCGFASPKRNFFQLMSDIHGPAWFAGNGSMKPEGCMVGMWQSVAR